MNAREYLRSQGFTVGERGRFSAEMLDALKAAGIESKAAPAPKVPKAPKPETPKRVVNVAPQKVVRLASNKNKVATSGNIRVVYDLCFECKRHAIYCDCNGGPKPPTGFVEATGAGLV